MKRLLPLILALLLLAGCASPEPALSTLSTTVPVTEPLPEPFGYYLEGSPMEAATGGALRVYPLDSRFCYGILPMGEELLLILGDEQAQPEAPDNHVTTPVILQRLSGENLHVSAELSIPDLVDPSLGLFQIGDSGLSYYNENTRQVVLLDRELRELRRIDVPEDLIGIPLLSPDWSALYYGTADAFQVLELESGLPRTLKEIYGGYKTLDALLLDGSVLQCSVSDGDFYRSMFLSTENGMTLHSSETPIQVETAGDRYYASFSDGPATALLFGRTGEEPRALYPRDYHSWCYLLPQAHAVLATITTPDALELEYYDLVSGQRTAALSLPPDTYPWYARATDGGLVYLLLYDETYSSETLYRWDPAMSPVTDSARYTSPYYTLSHPDYVGLDQLQTLADEIGSRHGIRLLLWQDAVEYAPWDYELEPEYMVPVLRQELTAMDGWLSHYPSGMLKTLAEHFGSLQLCLVRKIHGSAESGSLDVANGLQYWNGPSPYLALIPGTDTEKTLYHELFHIMESYILVNSNAYDSWDRLNPEGFAYDMDYVQNAGRNGDAYLQTETRSFIDTYSMSFPSEDRARIMEYAMTSGNEELFASPAMQAKLRQLSLGIRDAFGLRKSPEVFLWEQYLLEPLAFSE